MTQLARTRRSNLMMPYHENKNFVAYKQSELMRRADNYRLAQQARAGRRLVAFRFYYRALASFGQWLIVSGYGLQKRYGTLPDLSTPVHHHKPMPSNRRV
jgi:hypothetical protein